MSPPNGRSNSRIKKMAPATDKAQSKRAVTAVALGRENMLKLAKSRASQNTRTTKNGVGIALLFWANSNQRLRHVHAGLESRRLNRALRIGARRKLLDSLVETFGGGGRLDVARVLVVLRPHLLDH